MFYLFGLDQKAFIKTPFFSYRAKLIPQNKLPCTDKLDQVKN